MQKSPDWVSSEIYFYLCNWLLLWQSWYSLSEYVQQVQHFCHCLKNCCNCLYGTASCAVSSCSQISGTSGNLVPDTCSFICVNKKSQGARWNKWGWGTTAMLFAAKYCCSDKVVCASVLLWWSKLSRFFCCSGHFQQIAPSDTAKKTCRRNTDYLNGLEKKNSCWTVTSLKKKIIVLLVFILTCLSFLEHGEVDLSHRALLLDFWIRTINFGFNFCCSPQEEALIISDTQTYTTVSAYRYAPKAQTMQWSSACSSSPLKFVGTFHTRSFSCLHSMKWECLNHYWMFCCSCPHILLCSLLTDGLNANILQQMFSDF